jgi:hypothetical protein
MLLASSVLVLLWVSTLVSSHAIDVAVERHLAPRWDLAAHLVNGWTDYHYLVTGRLASLAWDLWSQGYWPPGQSLFQVPFYVAFGGDLRAGLLSSLGAFLLAGVAGVAVLRIIWGRAAWLASAFFLLFISTSSFVLAYASVAMSEMVGVLAQTVVLLAYARSVHTRRPADARCFAVSLTALFFVKYNYFLLLAVPLVCHEYLERTSGQSARDRAGAAWSGLRWLLSKPIGVALVLYGFVALAIEATGGTTLTVAGRRIDIRTIGYSAHPLLYAVIGRIAWLHRHRRVDWARIWAVDDRIRPLALWFVLPVAAWLASPHPNHIKDVANLLINVPMGEATARLGMAEYLRVVRDEYHLNPWLLGLALTGFVAATLRFRMQPPLVRLLILAAVLQFIMVSLHQTRDPRFVLLAMPAWWLASAGELAHWVARVHRWAPPVVIAAVAIATAAGADQAVRGATFERIAFGNYVSSPRLVDAFTAIRHAVGRDARTAVLGRRDAISPGLVRWQLGPPGGAAEFPLEVLGIADRAHLDTADAVILIAPIDTTLARPAESRDYARDMDRLRPFLQAGAFAMAAEYPVADLNARLTLYRRR